jgi:chromosome segregation ATPase
LLWGVPGEVDWSTLMPSKRGRAEPRWVVILEDIRSQNRATLEAVGASPTALAERIDRFEERTESRLDVVEAAIQSNSRGIAALDHRMGSLEGRMGSLEERLERSDEQTRIRFDALEAALQRIDQESRSRDASLELAVRDLKVSVQQNSVDTRDLAGKVEALSRLEERVSALERRGA